MQNHHVSFLTYFINSTQFPDVTVTKLRLKIFFLNQVIQNTLLSIIKTISMTTKQEVIRQP